MRKLLIILPLFFVYLTDVSIAHPPEETELITKIELSEDTQEKEKLNVELINKVRRHNVNTSLTESGNTYSGNCLEHRL